ncbi:Fic family protein [Zobellella taiwanensis]
MMLLACGLVQTERRTAQQQSQLAGLNTQPEDTVIRYLARSHVEFILIQPFREGNGRIYRSLFDVMALQASLPFSIVESPYHLHAFVTNRR